MVHWRNARTSWGEAIDNRLLFNARPTCYTPITTAEYFLHDLFNLIGIAVTGPHDQMTYYNYTKYNEYIN
jgi:hypothetical protein